MTLHNLNLANISRYSLALIVTLASVNSYAVIPARYLGTQQVINFTIASYTKVINANRLTGPDLAERYIERGLEYGRLFRYQQSVADFAQAISLNPSSTMAYVHRAVAYAKLEKYKQANADFSSALNIDNRNLSALGQRAALYYFRGMYAEAAEDFRLYLRYKPNDMYRMLWMYLAELNAHIISSPEQTSIRRLSRNTDFQQWPGALVELYLGEIPLEQLLNALKPILSSWDASHRCEVYFYIAQYHLSQGKKLQAIRYFDQAVKTKAKHQIEYEFAVAYLIKLQ